MGILFTETHAFLFTITLVFLFTVVHVFLFTISKKPRGYKMVGWPTNQSWGKK